MPKMESCLYHPGISVSRKSDKNDFFNLFSLSTVRDVLRLEILMRIRMKGLRESFVRFISRSSILLKSISS